MKLTRTLLLSLAGLAAVAVTRYSLLNLRLPIAELFQYGTGTLVVAGLLTMALGTERRAGPVAPPTLPPARRQLRRTPARRALASAL